MTFPIRYHFLGLELNSAVDRGASVELEDLRKHIIDETLFEWLPSVAPGIDLSPYGEADERTSIIETFNRFHGGNFGVRANGLCLLVAYCFEAMREGKQD